MITAGLTSVTFRNMTPAQILRLCCTAGITAVEWGSDIHVPAGAFETARSVRHLCGEAGVIPASYGSYYRCTRPEEAALYVETCAHLGADNIRVWAGETASATASSTQRALVRQSLTVLCRQALERSITVSLEFHENTLADSAQNTLCLLQEVNSPNLFTYWQVDLSASFDANLAAMQALLAGGRLSNVHVAHWENGEQQQLCAGETFWRKYLQTIGSSAISRYAFLEFVKDGAIENFSADAASLKALIAKTKNSKRGC